MIVTSCLEGPQRSKRNTVILNLKTRILYANAAKKVHNKFYEMKRLSRRSTRVERSLQDIVYLAIGEEEALEPRDMNNRQRNAVESCETEMLSSGPPGEQDVLKREMKN